MSQIPIVLLFPFSQRVVVVVLTLSILSVTELAGVNATGAQEVLVSHAEGLANGLGDQLGLRNKRSQDSKHWLLSAIILFLIMLYLPSSQELRVV